MVGFPQHSEGASGEHTPQSTYSVSDGVYERAHSHTRARTWTLGKPGCCRELGSLRCGDLFSSRSSKHYPVYSLNVASMWLKLGRLYMGLENKAAGEKALKKVRGAGGWDVPAVKSAECPCARGAGDCRSGGGAALGYPLAVAFWGAFCRWRWGLLPSLLLK